MMINHVTRVKGVVYYPYSFSDISRLCVILSEDKENGCFMYLNDASPRVFSIR